jgi:hypothetical protein
MIQQVVDKTNGYGSPLRGSRLTLNSQTNLRDHISPRGNITLSAVREPHPYIEEDLMNRTSSKKTVNSNKDTQSVNNSHVVVLEHVT